LRPDDVDRVQGTVQIFRAWKVSDEGVRLGPPKSAKSVRTINVADRVLLKLDSTCVATGFTKPVEIHGDWQPNQAGRSRKYRSS
jgi:hypothetical protein